MEMDAEEGRALMKGEGAVKKWKKGDRLTRGEAILAQCHECNDGHRGGNPDCNGTSCPLYQYMPYRGK